MVNHNAVELLYLLYPECYVPFGISSTSFAILFLVVYYFIAPKFIYRYFEHLQNDPKLYWRIINGFVSMVHCIIILILCTLTGDIRVSINQDMSDRLTTNSERTIGAISMGYFVYDLVVNCFIMSKIIANKFDYQYMFHHVLTIVSLGIFVVAAYSGPIYIIALFLNEITNPLLHVNNIRNRSKDHSKATTKSEHVIDILIKSLYLLLLVIARFVILGHIIYQVIFVYECSIYLKIIGSLVIILTIVLLPGLIKDILKTYNKYKNSLRYSVVGLDSDNSTVEMATEMMGIVDQDHQLDSIEYLNALSCAKHSVIQCFVAGTVYSFFHTNRMAIYVLYAEEFHPTTFQITLLLYGFNFWNGIAALLYSSLANQYGYDLFLVLLLVLQCIAVFLESVTNSFYLLFTAIMIGQVSITYIVLGYIAWILPEKHAKTYTAYFYATFMVSYLIGPMSAGFVSFYLSNRTVFVINFILCVCTLIHALLYVAKKQRKVEAKQLNVGLIEEKETAEQFPICLDRFEESEISREYKWYYLPKMSHYEWFMLISIIFINCTVSIIENSFVVYYALYVIKELNGNVIVGTCGFVVLAISFITGNLIVPKWFATESNNILKNKYVVM
eukprot:272641_1